MGHTFTFIVLGFIHNHVMHRSDLFCVDITSKTGFCRMSKDTLKTKFFSWVHEEGSVRAQHLQIRVETLHPKLRRRP